MSQKKPSLLSSIQVASEVASETWTGAVNASPNESLYSDTTLNTNTSGFDNSTRNITYTPISLDKLPYFK